MALKFKEKAYKFANISDLIFKGIEGAPYTKAMNAPYHSDLTYNVYIDYRYF